MNLTSPPPPTPAPEPGTLLLLGAGLLGLAQVRSRRIRHLAQRRPISNHLSD
ncbi:PEP-CTERM sorting domain-containing protein [Lamprobacter sp.]|uniref:PEP-CTERM sorting domain-containing protein n=1 Tax=Lamprobacter sp. TaxID=3100796 RepID=UPI003A4D8A9B